MSSGGRSKLAALAILVAVSGCGNARVSEALGNPPPVDSAAELRGQRAFMVHCHQCHVGGAGALGPALNDKPLPAFAIRTQVRAGLGAMPAFSEQELSRQALDDIIAYLFALRRAGPPDALSIDAGG